MENIMKELMEIENSANEYIKRADDEKKKLAGRISLKTFEIEKEANEDAKERLKQIISLINKEMAEEVAEIKRIGAEKLAALNEEYNLNKDNWIKEIFTDILYGVSSS